MYETNYDNYSSYAGSPNLGTAFLDSHMQSSFAGQKANSFGSVMSSFAGSVNQQASMGLMPGSNPQNLSPEQIAAQMNIGGPMSVLPYLANGAAQKFIFPIAGLWSLVDGVKAVNELRREASSEAGSYRGFDPSKLSYNQARERVDNLETEIHYY